MTREQIVNEIRTFAENHLQIKSFYEGRLDRQPTAQQNLYYRFMIQGEPSTIDQGKETFNFRVVVMGRVNLDYNNDPNTLSDTRQIMTDFISYFKNNPNLTSLTIQLPITINEDVEYSDDGVSGVFADVIISQYQGLDYCIVPVNTLSGDVLGTEDLNAVGTENGNYIQVN